MCILTVTYLGEGLPNWAKLRATANGEKIPEVGPFMEAGHPHSVEVPKGALIRLSGETRGRGRVVLDVSLLAGEGCAEVETRTGDFIRFDGAEVIP